jgi:hypothetical protein
MKDKIMYSNTFFCVMRLWPFSNMQILEVVRLEGQALTHDDGLLSRDIHLLQVMMMWVFRFSLVATNRC